MNNNNFVLYLHIVPNGKKYFGITGQRPKRRWDNGNGYRRQKHFFNAIKKYGWDNIKHVILADDLTEDEACFFERVMIALYDTTNRNNGYNKSTGGEYSATGYKHTEEAKQRIGEANRGKHLSEETKQKIGEANRGENNPMYGKHLSEEVKQKLSEANSGENSYLYGKYGYEHPKSKSVICITTGQCFGSASEAGRWFNLNSSCHISSCCNGKRKSAGKLPDGTKLVWKYISDLPKPQLTESDKQHLRDLLNHRGISSAQA